MIGEGNQLDMVNFTTVLDNFKRKFPKKDIYYVFGKDNENFAYAFKNKGKAIFVPTKKYNKEIEKYVFVTDFSPIKFKRFSKYICTKE